MALGSVTDFFPVALPGPADSALRVGSAAWCAVLSFPVFPAASMSSDAATGLLEGFQRFLVGGLSMLPAAVRAQLVVLQEPLDLAAVAGRFQRAAEEFGETSADGSDAAWAWGQLLASMDGLRLATRRGAVVLTASRTRLGFVARMRQRERADVLAPEEAQRILAEAARQVMDAGRDAGFHLELLQGEALRAFVGRWTRRAAAEWTPAKVDLGTPDAVVFPEGAAQVREVVAWPSAVPAGWVADTVLVGESAAVLSMAPVPPDVVRDQIRKALPSLQSAARESAKRNLVDAERERQIQDAVALLQAIAGGMVRHWDVQLSAVYWGDDAEAARASGNLARRRARERGVDLAALRHTQRQSYASALPGGRPVMRGLLLDQVAAAACWPFTDENLLDAGGVFVGVNERTGVPVLWDRWTPDAQHLLASGDTGFGKSYALKALLSQEAALGRPLLLLDPSATREYAPVARALGGAYLDLAPAGADRINPLAIAPDGRAVARGVDPDRTPGRPISERLAAVKPILAALVGESLETGLFDALAEAALQSCYRAAGFLDAWASCFDADWTPRAAWPVLSDVRRALEAMEDEEARRYARMLAPYCSGGSADLLDGQTTLAVDAAVVGLGLNEIIAVGGRFARGGYAAVMDFATQRFRSQPAARKCLLADEAHNLLGDPIMARWLERQLREARKQGVSVTVVSQGTSDFIGSPSGKAVFQNAAAKLYLHQPAADLDAAATALGVEAAVLREAAHLPRGHGILAVGTRTVRLQIRAPEALHEVFRTEAQREAMA